MTDDELQEMIEQDMELQDAELNDLENEIHNDIERGLSRKELEKKYEGRHLFDTYLIDHCDWNHTLRNRERGYVLPPKEEVNNQPDTENKPANPIISKIIFSCLAIVIFIVVLRACGKI